MNLDKSVWVFVGKNSRFPCGIFSTRDKAEEWVHKNSLTGTLSIMPFDQGVFDWAIENDMLSLKKEKVEEKSKDPNFIQDCLPASLEHYHYVNGENG